MQYYRIISNKFLQLLFSFCRSQQMDKSCSDRLKRALFVEGTEV